MKSVIVTGASSGIGHAPATAFPDAGWRVGLIARRAEPLVAPAERFAGAHRLPWYMTDAGAVAAAFERFAVIAGRLDALFTNAGMFEPAATPDAVTVEEFDKVMAINLRGMFIAARLAFTRIRSQAPQGGRIIMNGSLSAHSPRPGSICYTTSKHAINGMPCIGRR